MMGFPNRADKVTLSGGAWMSGLPRANLQNRVIGEVARTTNATLASTQFDMDMGPSGKARALSFRKHNMSLAARYRVRATNAEQKTNLLTYPRNFDNAAWVKGRAVVLPNVAVAPSGAMTADKLVEDTSNGGHYVEQSPTIVGVNTYERSVFIKAAEKKKAHLAFFSSPTTTSFAVVIFNTATGAFEGPGLGGSATQTYSAVAYPDGWWLLKQTVTLGSADTSCFCRVTLLGAGETTVGYAGDGTSGLYIWHMQLVPGAQPSAIVPDATAFVSRASSKWEFNAAGVLTQYAGDVAVTAYDPATHVSRGVSLEVATTNAIRNSTMAGVVVGTPGTLPTNWQYQSGVVGVSYSVVAAGTEDGIDYMDIRFFGTVTTAGALNIRPDAYPYPTSAAVGQNWVSSVFFKLVSGTFSGVTSHYLVIEETNSSDAYLSGQGYVRPAPTGAALNSQRATATRQLASATTAKVGGYIGVSVSLGAEMDFTLRIGLPQLEQGAFASSPIKTSTVAVTRAADISVSPQVTLPAGYMDDLQPATYDSDWQDVWPTVYPFGTLEWGDENWWSGKYTVDETEGYIAELVHILPTDRYERWWRIEFDDQANADGYIEIGRLFIGPVWQPKINMNYEGASLGWETTTEARQAISGAEYFSDGINYRVQRFTLGHMDQDEAFSQAFELQRRAGISGEILWIHDPADTVHALRRRYLARLRQLSPIDYPYVNANSTAFELKELL